MCTLGGEDGDLSSPPDFSYLAHLLQAKHTSPHTPSSLACYSGKQPAIYSELINLPSACGPPRLWPSSSPGVWMGKARGGHLAPAELASSGLTVGNLGVGINP